MTEEMTYRTVEARVKVQAGSDDHAKWQVFHALDFNGVMIDGEPAQWLEDILSAVCHNELITGEHIDNAAYLLNYHIDGGYANAPIIENVAVKKCACVVPEVDTEPLEHDDDCPVYQKMIDQYKERGGI